MLPSNIKYTSVCNLCEVDELRWQYRQLEKISNYKGEKGSLRKMIKHVIYNNPHNDPNTSTATSMEEAICRIITLFKKVHHFNKAHLHIFSPSLGDWW
jgi:hypothetical protein